MRSDVPLCVLASIEGADELAILPELPPNDDSIADATFSVPLESLDSLNSADLCCFHVHSKAHSAQGVKR